MKILFVCTGNVDRSPTAEEMFSDVEGVEAKSAGTSIVAATRLSKELIEWSDLIFAMEDKHREAVLELNSDVWRKIEVLDIPDRYSHNQPELRQLLRRKLRRFL